MASSGESASFQPGPVNSRDELARHASSKWWARTPILLPILFQVLGGLLALAGLQETGLPDTGLPDTGLPDTRFSMGDHSRGDQALGEHADSRAPSKETDEVPPASSYDAGNVPAGVKLSQGLWPESSRFAAGSRPAAHGVRVPVSAACHRRDRLASLSPLVASSPLGGSLSPLSPRGPPVA